MSWLPAKPKTVRYAVAGAQLAAHSLDGGSTLGAITLIRPLGSFYLLVSITEVIHVNLCRHSAE